MKHVYPISPYLGLNKSRPAHEIPLGYTPDCSGVWPQDGRIERIPGKAKFASNQLAGAGVLKQFAFRDGPGTKHVLAISTSKAYKFNAATSQYDSIQNASDFTTGRDDPVACCNFFDSAGAEIAVIANLKDAMRKYTGSGTLANLGGSPPKAQLLLSFRGYLLAGYVDESGAVDPRKIRFSALFNGESWPTGNYFLLKSYTDWLVSLKLLRDRAVLYKQNSISLLDYVGGSLIFDLTENYKNGIGPVSDAAVVQWGRYGEKHFFIGQDTNIYEFDGIDDSAISTAVDGVLKNINAAVKSRISGTALPEQGKIIWAVPTGGDTDCKDLVIFDVRERSWWIKTAEPIAISSFGNASTETSYQWDSLPHPSWDQWDQDSWDSADVSANNPSVLVGGADCYVRKLQSGVDDDGSALPSHYLWPFDNLDGRDDTLKTVSKVYVQIKSSGSSQISLTVFADNNSLDAVVLGDDGAASRPVDLYGQDLSAGYVTVGVSVFLTCKNVSAKLASTGQAWSGKVVGYEYQIIGEIM